MAQEVRPRRAHGRKRAAKATRQVRFDARMSPELKVLLQRAADLGDETLSAFVLSSAREAAARRIREHEVLTLSVRDSERFVESLRHPPEPNDFMVDAARQHAALIES